MRKGSLAGLSSRNALLVEKTIEAVEKLWSAVIDLRKLHPAAQLMRVVKFESAAERTKSDPRLKQTFEQLFSPYDIKFPIGVNGSLYRPFLSRKAWAYFECYQFILYDAYLQNETIKYGVGKDLYNEKAVYEFVGTTLPEYSKVVEAARDTGLSLLLGPLEDSLLQELQSILEGKTEDQQTVVNASEIIRLSDRVHQDIRSLEQAEVVEKIPAEFRRSNS